MIGQKWQPLQRKNRQRGTMRTKASRTYMILKTTSSQKETPRLSRRFQLNVDAANRHRKRSRQRHRHDGHPFSSSTTPSSSFFFLFFFSHVSIFIFPIEPKKKDLIKLLSLPPLPLSDSVCREVKMEDCPSNETEDYP